jgi:hypothetical protein
MASWLMCRLCGLDRNSQRTAHAKKFKDSRDAAPLYKAASNHSFLPMFGGRTMPGLGLPRP